MEFPFLSFMNRRPYKIGVAFSGGGARGFAHAGALQALGDMGVKPDVVAGVSAGSVVATMYASGMTPREMVDVFRGMSFRDFCELGVPKGGFFDLEGFGSFLRDCIPYRNLEDLPLPTIVCATDLDRCECKAWDKGELSRRVMASCCMPIIFKPIVIEGVHYVDGGVLHNLPAWALRDKCKYLIGLNCSPMPGGGYKTSLIDIAHRTYNMMAKSNARGDMDLCDLAIEFGEIASYKVFNLREVRRVYRAGYDETVRSLTACGFKARGELKSIF